MTQFDFNVSKEVLSNAQLICKEIIKQIKYPNFWVYGSWGADKFTYGVSIEGNPILRFKVNGHKFKGYVHIIYMPMDWYNIEFVSTRNNLKHKIEEVYFDELQEKIDNYVEKIDDYIF